MYFHLHRKSKKWIFIAQKFLNMNFLIALHRNSESEPFYCINLLNIAFLNDLRRMLKSGYFDLI